MPEKVDVLIVTHNRAHLLEETIRSVLAQSYSVFELIIIDDGSTDHTEELIRSIKDSRIQYFKYPRIGILSRLRNIAVSKSKSDYIAFIDSDDLWHPDKLLKSVNACRSNKASVCLTDCLVFNKSLEGNSRAKHLVNKTNIDIRKEILFNNLPLAYGSNLFFSRDVFTGNKFNEKLIFGDHDFLILAMYQFKVVFLADVLVYIRRHQSNMTEVKGDNWLIPMNEFYLTIDKLLDLNYIQLKDHKFLFAKIFTSFQ